VRNVGYIPEAEGSVVPGEVGYSRENSEDQSCSDAGLPQPLYRVL